MKVRQAFVDVFHYGSIPARVLIVEEEDIGKLPLCENCARPFGNHPELARDVNTDWCLNCNDTEMKRQGMTDIEHSHWTMMKIQQGKIIATFSEVDPNTVVVSKEEE